MLRVVVCARKVLQELLPPHSATPHVAKHKLEPQRHHGVKSNLGGRMLGRVGGKEAKCAYRTER